MQNHWPGGKNPNKKGKGPKPKKDLSGKKKAEKKAKGKEKAPASANVLSVPEMGELSILTTQSIDFSCYETSEKVEWCLDSGCTDQITPSKSIGFMPILILKDSRNDVSEFVVCNSGYIIQVLPGSGFV